ncbi:MAG: family 10 glycosylhydrolase [Luteolibacter sp.]
MRIRLSALLLLLCCLVSAQDYASSGEKPPRVTREFRAAWVATVYNIDWPSSAGLGAATQQAQARAILDKLVSLKMNAVILQVRPNADALYKSDIEPWSQWLTGTMGKSPGYDPLQYWIEQGHARGIEVHAWFNPFRALSNSSHSCAANHISKTQPQVIKKYGSMLWCDPSHPDTQSQALRVIMDVVARYDIDGVHLDDYFYPYPAGGETFKDGKSPAQRRAAVDDFVKRLYSSVKKSKPWVRVGISPFGIWRPGVPTGIEAGLDAYEDLAADSRKWLVNGWVDYLAPQLYWRIEPKKQSFYLLLEWWRGQGGERPVWPGIATSRIRSSEDPGRTSSEIINQISLSRSIGNNWAGQLHWSMKALLNNQGGISDSLAKAYTQPVAIPPMTWVNQNHPATPRAGASVMQGETSVRWEPAAASRIAVQARYGQTWRTMAIVPSSRKSLTIPRADAIAVSSIDRFGNISSPKVLTPR